MTFAAPMWLALLLPWAATVAWLLRARSPRADVPYVELWRDTDVPRQTSQRVIRSPGAALACALIATLLALLASARPGVGGMEKQILMIVDQGATMPDRAWEGPAGEVERHVADGAILRIATNDIHDEIARQQTDSTSPIVVITNQALTAHDRIVPVAPPPVANIGIVLLAARVVPTPAVLVRIRNESDLPRAAVQIASSPSNPIELPVRGEERDYVFALDATHETVDVQLIVDDRIAADNRARLVRQRLSVRLEPRVSLPPELQRMIDVYTRHLPASEGSPRVVVTDNPLRLGPNDAAIVVATDGRANLANDAALRIADHAITRNVRDWQVVLKDPELSITPAPDEGWIPLVSAGDVVLLAVREQPARQVWVGFRSPALARSPDVVVFWTDAFDFVGSTGGEEYGLAQPAHLDIRQAGGPEEVWRDRLDALLAASPRMPARMELSSPLLLASLAFLAISVLLWSRSKRRVTTSASGVVAASKLA